MTGECESAAAAAAAAVAAKPVKGSAAKLLSRSVYSDRMYVNERQMFSGVANKLIQTSESERGARREEEEKEKVVVVVKKTYNRQLWTRPRRRRMRSCPPASATYIRGATPFMANIVEKGEKKTPRCKQIHNIYTHARRTAPASTNQRFETHQMLTKSYTPAHATKVVGISTYIRISVVATSAVPSSGL